MSYYTTLIDVDFVIPETPETLKALHDLNTNPKYHQFKNGGQYIGIPSKEVRWFSKMPKNYHELPKYQSVEGIFECLGFNFNWAPNGIELTEYHNKAGDEEYFLAAVAPYVANGSYLVFVGEDHAMWRYDVIDGKLQKSTGKISLIVTHTNFVLKD